jgi:hypothetical protein
MDAFASGNNAMALVNLEAAYKCRPEVETLKKTFAAACKAKNVSKAKQYFRKLSPALQGSMQVFCVQNGIDRPMLDAP